MKLWLLFYAAYIYNLILLHLFAIQFEFSLLNTFIIV